MRLSSYYTLFVEISMNYLGLSKEKVGYLYFRVLFILIKLSVVVKFISRIYKCDVNLYLIKKTKTDRQGRILGYVNRIVSIL